MLRCGTFCFLCFVVFVLSALYGVVMVLVTHGSGLLGCEVHGCYSELLGLGRLIVARYIWMLVMMCCE